MARCAPSSREPASVMRRSRSFWNSRMPLAKMRSMGLPLRALADAAAYSSLRLPPDQKSRSKLSVSRRMRLRASAFLNMAAQLMTDTVMSSSTTACTTQLALSMSSRMEKSVGMWGGLED